MQFGPHVVSQLQKAVCLSPRSLFSPSDLQLLQGLVLITISALVSIYSQLSLSFTHCRRPSFPFFFLIIMKFSLAIASLLVLPFAAAAPTCSLKSSSAASVATPTSTSTATPPGSTSTPTNPGNGSVAMAWFANWHTDYTVANITWSGFNRISYFG